MWFVLYCSLLLKNNESFSRTTPTIPVQVSPIFVFPESKYTTLLPPVIGSHSDYSLSLSLSSSSRWYARSKQGPFRIINLFPVPVAAPPQSIYVNRVRMKNSVPFVDRGRLLREKQFRQNTWRISFAPPPPPSFVLAPMHFRGLHL